MRSRHDDFVTDVVATAAAGATVDRAAAHRVAEDLVRWWSEPHRRYHTTEHLTEVLTALDELTAAGAASGRPAAVARLAAWFHDAVYAVGAGHSPGAADEVESNEADSASLAETTLIALHVDPGVVDDVATLIRDSRTHEMSRPGPAAAAFHDADLWILSAGPARFDAYCAQVREEFAHLDDAAYAEGRTAILRPIMERDSIYLGDWAKRHWGPVARRNLGRELARLAG